MQLGTQKMNLFKPYCRPVSADKAAGGLQSLYDSHWLQNLTTYSICKMKP